VISVILAVKDGGGALVDCLQAVRVQVIDEPVEIIVVDSGSSDGSVRAARAAGASVHEIAPERFTHGRSRNLGARAAQGDTLVFLSQDAIPADRGWLAHLVAPLRTQDDLAGVYGRQLPNPDAIPPEVYFLDFLYGPRPRRQQAAGQHELSMDTTLFSNVNSAMPRSVWARFPFAEDIVMSEDQEWSRRALLAGLAIAYEPDAAVRHSHAYTPLIAFRRFFDSGVSADRAYMASARAGGRALRRAAVRYAGGELAWLVRTRQARWIPYAILYELAKLLGLIAGMQHRRLPLAVKRRFSALPASWLIDPSGPSAGPTVPEPVR
jgi:glycosyltransferase involved in cell wall biosynthesis